MKHRAFVLALLGALLTTACGGGGGGSYSGTTPVNTQNSASASGPVLQSAGTLPFPSFGGFSGVITTPPTSSGAGAQALVTVQIGAPSAVPALSGGLLYASVSFSNAVSFSGTPGFSISVPGSTAHTFYVAFYDPTKPSPAWQTAWLGPATVSGSSLAFAGTATVTTFAANTTYWFGIY